MPHPPPSPPARPPRLRPVQTTPQSSTRPAPDRAVQEEEPTLGPEGVVERVASRTASPPPPPESTSTRSGRSQYSVPFLYRERAASPRRRQEGPSSQPLRTLTQAGASAAPQPFSSLDQAQGERLFGAWPPPPLLDGDEEDPFAYDPPARPRRMSRTWPREGTGSAPGSPGARASRHGTQGTFFSSSPCAEKLTPVVSTEDRVVESPESLPLSAGEARGRVSAPSLQTHGGPTSSPDEARGGSFFGRLARGIRRRSSSLRRRPPVAPEEETIPAGPPPPSSPPPHSSPVIPATPPSLASLRSPAELSPQSPPAPAFDAQQPLASSPVASPPAVTLRSPPPTSPPTLHDDTPIPSPPASALADPSYFRSRPFRTLHWSFLPSRSARVVANRQPILDRELSEEERQWVERAGRVADDGGTRDRWDNPIGGRGDWGRTVLSGSFLSRCEMEVLLGSLLERVHSCRSDRDRDRSLELVRRSLSKPRQLSHLAQKPQTNRHLEPRLQRLGVGGGADEAATAEASWPRGVVLRSLERVGLSGPRLADPIEAASPAVVSFSRYGGV